MTSIFAVAHRGTFDQFKELFSGSSELRVGDRVLVGGCG